MNKKRFLWIIPILCLISRAFSQEYNDITALKNCPDNILSRYGTNLNRNEYARELFLSACKDTYGNDATVCDQVPDSDALKFADLPEDVTEDYCEIACNVGRCLYDIVVCLF